MTLPLDVTIMRRHNAYWCYLTFLCKLCNVREEKTDVTNQLMSMYAIKIVALCVTQFIHLIILQLQYADHIMKWSNNGKRYIVRVYCKMIMLCHLTVMMIATVFTTALWILINKGIDLRITTPSHRISFVAQLTDDFAEKWYPNDLCIAPVNFFISLEIECNCCTDNLVLV